MSTWSIRLAFACASFLVVATAQASLELEPQGGAGIRSFDQFEVRTQTGALVAGRDGRLSAGFLDGVDAGGATVHLSRDEIGSLQVSDGSHARGGVALGAGLGLLAASVTVMLMYGDDAHTVEFADVLPVMLGMPAGGAMVGLVVGSQITAWDDVDVHRAPISSGMAAKPLLCCRISF
jgi:hypothetical protein